MRPLRRSTGWVSLRFQIGAVVALFLAALIALASSGLGAIRREGRRAHSEQTLRRANEALARAGHRDLTALSMRREMSKAEWAELDRHLAAGTARSLAGVAGVEGGYFRREGRRFLGTAGPGPRSSPFPGRGPPPKEFELIEIQADAAIRKRQAVYVVEIVPPSLVAVRTAPVFERPGGRVVAATWTMTRLDDPEFLGRSIRGYAIAAGLSLGGIALALALTAGLARSLRLASLEQKRLHDELRRSERLAALGKLLAGVAHEVRNPLAGIRGITQLWRRGLGQTDEAFAHLMDEVDRLEDIVSRLLQFTRAEASVLRPGDLGPVVAEAARLAEQRAAEQSVRVEVSLASGLPTVAMSAPGLLQILRNLTGNALQAMPGGGLLRLETRRDPRTGEVQAIVADTGPGLSPEARDHLFEPFFTTKADGTGLGLSIAREIALAHGGDLQAEPAGPGRGATFILRLPAAPAEAGPRPEPRA